MIEQSSRHRLGKMFFFIRNFYWFIIRNYVNSFKLCSFLINQAIKNNVSIVVILIKCVFFLSGITLILFGKQATEQNGFIPK